jgi:peptidyl-prolyl cis-trans isomerase D
MAKQPTQKVVSKKHLARLEKERIQQRYLLIGAGVVLVLVVGLILYGILDQLVFNTIQPVAKVGNESITTGEFQKQVRFSRQRSIDQLRSLTADPMYLQFFGSYIQELVTRLTSPNAIGQEVLDGLVEDILVAKKAKELGISVTDEEVNKELEQAFGYFENGTPTPTITPTPFVYSTSTLSPTQLALIPPTQTPGPTEAPVDEATPTGEPVTSTPDPNVTATPEASPTIEMTPTITLTPTITPTPTAYTRDMYDGQVATFVSNNSSIKFSERDLREYIYRQVLRRKVYEAITKDVSSVGEQVWARHILVATEEEAKNVLPRLKAGESFVDLARELSTDESNKDSGGDLGWFGRGQMVTAFEDAAFQMEIGEISQPVQTDFGWHVIQVLGHEERPLGPDEFEQAKSKIYQDWVAQAKTETTVETFDRWTEVVPSDPEVPADILAQLQQMQQQQQQQP